MGWITVYITGRSGFREEVLKKLESSSVNFMPGNIGVSSDLEPHDLYWLDDKVDLKKFKQAIGSKLIWKYRLSFFTSLEAFVESQKNERKGAPAEDDPMIFSVPGSPSAGPGLRD